MQHSEPTDADLVAQTLAGNREAFGCLYDRYARLVRAVVCGVTLDWPMVQDLAQESFLRAYRNLARLKEPQRFGAWIVGIARHVARERKRSLRRDRHQFVGDAPLEIELPSDAAGAVQAAEELEWVMQQLTTLDERQRLAIHAFFLQGRDALQAAELLGLSRSGLYALVERALKRLAERVEQREPERETR
ncbi:MAG TPA: sigma-70 family RNA polymerase sigma factor [Pirellulales bacterium]|nr:sigma-70 family RNA polymerase sigma factor [Pirellulales bacterium]